MGGLQLALWLFVLIVIFSNDCPKFQVWTLWSAGLAAEGILDEVRWTTGRQGEADKSLMIAPRAVNFEKMLLNASSLLLPLLYCGLTADSKSRCSSARDL